MIMLVRKRREDSILLIVSLIVNIGGLLVLVKVCLVKLIVKVMGIVI